MPTAGTKLELICYPYDSSAARPGPAACCGPRAEVTRAALALLPILLSACEVPASALGPTREEAQVRGSELLQALAGRFGPLDREPSFEALRPKLLQNALTPSRIVDDPLAWTTWEEARRTVEVSGWPEPSGYRIGLRAGATRPRRPGEYRGVLRLRVENRGTYEWRVRDELAVGALRPDDAARAFEVLLRGAESAAAKGRGEPVDLRARVLKAFPLAASAWGRLYSLEALRAARESDGATVLELRVALEPARLRPVAPRYAWFLERYAAPIELHAEARVTASAEPPSLSSITPAIWSLAVAQRRATLLLRVREGRAVPAGTRTEGQSGVIRVALDYSTRAGPFRVGVRKLEADLELVSTSDEKAFSASFRREPEWRLPFLIRPFLRGSLRRPFEGAGASLRYGLARRDDVTSLERDYRLAVKESWILRWIGGLSSTAVTDFRRHAEAESDRFTAEGLHALRRDLEDLLGGSPPR